MQRDFEELPPEAVIGLRESLVALLFRFAKGAPPVRTQLCLAVAAMAAHLPAQHWDGGSIVRWLMQRCQAVSQDVALPCLLEMLIVLPQEATSHKVAARPERRRQFHMELQEQAPDALQVPLPPQPLPLLTQPPHDPRGARRPSQAAAHPPPRAARAHPTAQVLASSADSNAGASRSLVLAAFGAWLRLTEGRGLDSGLAQHPLVATALAGLQDASTFDAAVDAVRR